MGAPPEPSSRASGRSLLFRGRRPGASNRRGRQLSEYVLEVRNVTKSFSSVKALDGVGFQLRKGEIHVIMGENGAGKSTFIKVLTGVHKADSGEIYLNGNLVSFKSPRDAQMAGIAAIYQHIVAYNDLSVAENIFMGHEIMRHGHISWKDMFVQANALLRQLNTDFDAKREMGSLSVAQQQMVQIAKAMSMNAKIIIMDEPTAALTKRESEELYRVTEKFRDEGASIIFITHRFEDTFRLAQRVTVFRDSRYIGTYDAGEISEKALITAMVGREITDLYPKPAIEPGEEVLRVEGLSRAGLFKDISFSVRKGEILGITGLVGAGRTEVMEAVYGAERLDEGSIYVEGRKVRIGCVQDALRLGIGMLTEDRQNKGLVMDWGIGRNITLAEIQKIGGKVFTNEKEERRIAKALAEKVETKAQSIFDKVRSLSGGNQQKVVVAKILASKLKVLIMDEPTKGIDVGAKVEIYKIMGDLAKEGYAIIMISSEMPEILGMSDRILVMCEGRATAELSRKEATPEAILQNAMARTHAGGKAAGAE